MTASGDSNKQKTKTIEKVINIPVVRRYKRKTLDNTCKFVSLSKYLKNCITYVFQLL